MQLPAYDDLLRAAKIVRQVMPPTPTCTWPLLSERAGAEVWLKHENHSPVGAFKLRGAMVYLDWLRREHPRVTGVAAATRGNYGQGVARASTHYGVTATIVVPHGNSPAKNRAMQALGAELIEHGEDFQSSLEYAAELAKERGLHMIPSFHPLLVHGTGTYALEMFEDAPELEAVYVPIGLGSSICGVMAAKAALELRTAPGLKAAPRLSTKIVGVVAKASPSYALSFKAGHVVTHPAETRIADGLACRVPNADALEAILQGVDHIVEVTEGEIAAAMRVLFEDTHNLAEGAGAAAVAGLLREREAVAGRRVGAVLTGGNVDRETFLAAMEQTGDAA
ncbi:threonine dehydratase [Paracidobacterium acidisoli]|uniref:Threonine dehydratase n=1 Tax=Paracidobacterium acidisoli TaxID=2303751 RepID=A0A372IT22_9BACT|nr:threonine dehydratase [Paracidobacterium acidisoli]MBT9330468.1 threonine dehydratase [Paracidobacterium acidisoli]